MKRRASIHAFPTFFRVPDVAVTSARGTGGLETEGRSFCGPAVFPLAPLGRNGYLEQAPQNMPRPTSSKLTEGLPETLDRVVTGRERVIVRRLGKEVAAIVPLRDLAALEEMEDRRDVKDFRAAKREWKRGGRKTVAWDKLKAELDL